jgi:hypothetical protein
MRTWTRSDRIALISLIIGAVGSGAAVVALWGPLDGSQKKGVFHMPTVEWEYDSGNPKFSGVRLAFNEKHEVVGFGDMEITPLDGCSGPGSEVFTVVEPRHIEGTTLLDGIIVEDASGDRITFSINPNFASRMSPSHASWIKAVFAKGRRVFLTYWACGTSMLRVTDVLAE